MAEYIERESLVEDIKQYSCARIDNDAIDKMGFQFVEEIVSILRIIEKQPAADVVEVVRCKDCEYSTLIFGTYVCDNIESPWYNDEFDIDVGANDFCSFGERKEGADNG